MTNYQLGIILSTIFQASNAPYSTLFAIIWLVFALINIKKQNETKN